MIFAARPQMGDYWPLPSCCVAPAFSQCVVFWQVEKQLAWSSNGRVFTAWHETAPISLPRCHISQSQAQQSAQSHGAGHGVSVI